MKKNQSSLARVALALDDQCAQLGRALGRLVKLEMQRGHRVDGQTLEQTVANESGGLVQGDFGLDRITDQQRETAPSRGHSRASRQRH